MRPPCGGSPALRAALAAALLAAGAPGRPVSLHTAATQPPGRRAAAAPEPTSPLPEPFGWALLSMLGAATAGACVVDLTVPDGRRLAWWRRGAEGWTLRLLGKLVVGSAAAAVLVAVNPVEAGWWRTGVTALLGGVGGQALLLAVVATRKAHLAEGERDAARREARRLARAGARRIEELRSLAVRLHRRARARVPPAVGAAAAPARASPFELVINSVAEHATAELVDDEDEGRGFA